MFAPKLTPTAFVHSLAVAAMIFFVGAWATPANAFVYPNQSENDEFFEKKVRPILAERCWGCHSADAGESKGSLRLDHGTLIEAFFTKPKKGEPQFLGVSQFDSLG